MFRAIRLADTQPRHQQPISKESGKEAVMQHVELISLPQAGDPGGKKTMTTSHNSSPGPSDSSGLLYLINYIARGSRPSQCYNRMYGLHFDVIK